ncbi:MAG: hypothetical protein BGO10_06245 [Chlamydia sp. 32-24]|nr:MAG: hypothetical protein BGO10_06245 [Chlamydia sp. 32-24]
MRYSLKALFTASLMLTAQTCAFSKEITLISQDGENYTLDVPSNEPFFTVIEKIGKNLEERDQEALNELRNYNDVSNLYQLDVLVKGPEVTAAAVKTGSPRNYYGPINEEDKKNLSFILNTLAKENLLKIAKKKSSLTSAGKKIAHLHPLKFLYIVFTDEELKSDINALQNKGWVWNDFKESIVESFAKEKKLGNLKEEYLVDFSSAVNVDPNLFMNSYVNGRWEEMLNSMIQNIPRNGQTDRYKI